ncbi:hypothetical protein D3C84_660680 [compost metagenome]
MPDQGIHVGPTGVAANGVDLLVTGEGIDQCVLLGDQRITRRGFLSSDVWNPANAGPNGFCGPGDRNIEVLEEPALCGQAIDVGCRIDRVAIGADGTGTQRLEHDKHHVRRPCARYLVGLWRLVTDEVQGLWIGLIHAQVLGNHGVVFTHLRFVIARLADLDRVVEENHRVQAQRSDLVIAGEERIAPAQRDRVFQVHVLDTAQNTQQHQHDHQRATPSGGERVNGFTGAVQRHAFQAHQGQRHQGDRCQPPQ